jgi:hypothetical protein
MREEHCRHSRTTVQEKKNRSGAIVASNENPLLNSPDLMVLQQTNASGRIDIRRTTPQDNEFENHAPNAKKRNGGKAEQKGSTSYLHFTATVHAQGVVISRPPNRADERRTVPTCPSFLNNAGAERPLQRRLSRHC